MRWAAPDHDRVTAAFAVGETPLELELRLDAAGRVLSLAFDRWDEGEFFCYRITELRPAT